MRVLVFMAHPGHARNFESTLRLLCARGHEVRVAVDRVEKTTMKGTSRLLEQLVAEYPTLSWDRAPSVRDRDWATVGIGCRAALDHLRFVGQGFTQSDAIRQRAAGRVPFLARMVRARRLLRATERSVPLRPEVVDFIREWAPDAVLVTPLVELGSRQVDYVRAARAAGAPTGLLVASWDNLTMKGLIHEVPDLVAVWNDVQRREAIELHGVPEQRIAVTGAVAYDHWFEWAPRATREEFCARVGLDAERPYVLYVGSSAFIAPDEADFAREWSRAVTDGGRRQALLRPHPTNPLPAEELETDGVAVYPRTPTNPTDEATRSDYFESIHHSAAVVGINTSAFIESAIMGRPVFAPLPPRYRETQRDIQHFNYLLEDNGGMLRTSDSLQDHTAQLAAGVPEDLNPRFVAWFVRPRGVDRPAAEHLVAAIEGLGASSPQQAEPLGRAAALAGRTLARAGHVLARWRRAIHAVRPALGRLLGRGE